MIKIVLLTCSLFMFTNSIAQKGAKYDLNNFPKGASPKEIGVRLVKKFIRTPHTYYGYPQHEKKVTQIYYPEVCTWLGSLWFANRLEDKTLQKQLEKRFLPLMDTLKIMQPVPNHVDNNVFGSIPLELYRQFPKKDYLSLGLMYANSQWTLPKNAKPEEKQWADKGYSWQTRIWIDDMFMITALQTQAHLVTGENEYINRAANQMEMYLDAIQLPNGLFYHSPDAPYCWGRGNGWMAVGMAEILKALPQSHPNRDRIMSGYQKMMKSLLKYQTEDGMWRQLVDDPKLWKETSGTAMFTYAMIVGVKSGWLDQKIYGGAVRNAWLSLVNYIDIDDNITQVCQGTSIRNDRDHYVNRQRVSGDLHGQAPMIWCAYALLEK